MLNLIKAEIYQLRTRTSSKIWLLIALLGGLLMALFPHFIILLMNNPVEGENFSLTAQSPESGLVGYTITSHIGIGMEIVHGMAVFALFLMAYIAFNQELKNRTIINPLIVGRPRYQVYLVKYLGAILMSVAFYFVFVISFTMFNLLINGGNIGQYIDLIVIERFIPSIPVWLMWLAFYMILLFISASEYTFLIYIIAEVIVNQFVGFIGNHIEFVQRIEPYLCYNIVDHTEKIVNGVNIVPYLSLLYIVLFLMIGIYFFKRKEIK
jgi:ABC-type transport system involved in multi-copper enzyme maturation permease subunit